jgi:hypothetical protein
MTNCRNLIIAALACAAVGSVAAASPAAAKSGSIPTGEKNAHEGRAGYAYYTTTPVKGDVPGETWARVTLKACDAKKDGYGIVATIWQHGLTRDELDARGGASTCSKKRTYRLRGKVELRVCAHDQDNDVGSQRLGYVACSDRKVVANY